MKRMLVLLFTIVIIFTMMLSVSASSVTTIIQDETDRKIAVKGLGKDGNFPANPEVAGQSPTTGMPWTGTYQPILVQIDNTNGGIGYLAPWGASYADVIYETPLHKNGNTRISFLFSDFVPDSVGPVRSARMTHAELREEWDAGFVYYGGQEYKGSNINDLFKKTGATKKGVLFSGIVSKNKPWKKYYTRVKGMSSPNNVDANVKAMQALLPSKHKAPSRPFLFTDELPNMGDLATNITVEQKMKDYVSTFKYDSNANVYLRYVAEEPYVDKTTQEQLSFSNLIIQRTNLTFYNGSNDRPMTVNIGSGNADIFIGGRYISGYWVRTDMNQRTVFFDQDGNELRFQRGKTFICMVDYSLRVSYSAE